MNIYKPSLDRSTADGYQNNHDFNSAISYEEVDLPFDVIEEDSITSQQVVGALNSDQVRQELPGYRFANDFDGEDYTVKAVNYSLKGVFPGNQQPSIEFEVGHGGEHSYLRPRLSAPGERELEDLTRDLDGIEEGMEKYFRNRQMADLGEGMSATAYGLFLRFL